jgi:hypothetical protein
MIRRLTTLFMLVSSCALAQRPMTAGVPDVTYTLSNPGTQIVLPALTPVLIQFDDKVSSDGNRNGDRFRFHVAADVRVGEVIVIPAGSPGEGEVIHAQRSGMAGKAGELIVAARHVTVGGRTIRLRSFAAGTGQQHTDLATWTGMLISFPALMIQGGVMTMPRNMVANARTAQSASLPAWSVTRQPQDEPMQTINP